MEEASHHNLLYETLRDTRVLTQPGNFLLTSACIVFLERKQPVLIMESGVGDRSGQLPETVSEGHETFVNSLNSAQ